MSLVRSMIAQTLNVSFPVLAACFADLSTQAMRGNYCDSRNRAERRRLLDAAGMLNADVKLAFLKLDGTLRYMLARPVVDADPTCRYYTVQDLELSEQAGRTVYRRVNLDTLAGAEVVFKRGAY